MERNYIRTGKIVMWDEKEGKNGRWFTWFKLDFKNSTPLFIAYDSKTRGMKFIQNGLTVTVEGRQAGDSTTTVFVSCITHRSTVIHGYHPTDCPECQGHGTSFPEGADEPKMHCDSCGRRVDLV